MKKILLLLFILISLKSNAQLSVGSYIYPVNNSPYATHIDTFGRGGYMVVQDTFARNGILNVKRKNGMAVYVQTTKKLYILADTLESLYNNWIEFSNGDTVSISNRINGKIDSLNLSGDSVYAIRNTITGGVPITTTTFQYKNPYLKGTDTVSLSNRINLKLNSTDTASLSNRINLKLNSTDTASLSNRMNNKIDSLQVSNDSVYALRYKIINGVSSIVKTFQYLKGGTVTKAVDSVYKTNNGDSIYVRYNSGTTLRLKDSIGVPPSRTITTNSPLQGSGNLSSNLTLSMTQSSNASNGWLSSSDWLSFYNKANNTISINATLGSGSNLSGGGNLTTSRVIVIPKATTSVDGYLSAVDYQSFASRQVQLSPVEPIKLSGGLISMSKASSTDSGYLSSANWNTFNSKLSASDTISLSNRINQKLNISDTSEMLSKYLRKSDTVTLSNRINLKLNASDTSKYVKNTTQISATYPLSSSGDLSSGVNLSMLQADNFQSGYLSFTDYDYFSQKLDKAVDTIYRTAGKDSIQFKINGAYFAIKDSAGGSGTVTKAVDTIFRTSGKDSIIFNINGVRYAIKDSVSYGGGGVTTVSGTSPISSSGGANPVISIQQATSSQSGYLSSADYSYFNGKVGSVTATYPVLSSGGNTPNISMYQASNTVDGFLTTTDWIKFNNKVDSVSVSGGVLTKTGTTNPVISSSINSSKLVGRGTSGSGTMQEITIGSGLSMSGTTLSAIGGGGGGSQTLQQTLTVGDTLTTYFYFKTNLANDSTVNLNGARLTAPRIYDFPDSSGILALKSDLLPLNYQIDLTSSNYAMTGEGVYEIKIGTDSTSPYYITFPSASTNDGKRITLTNADASGNFNNAIIDTSENAPKYQGTNKTIWDIPYGMTYEFISINNKWMSTNAMPSNTQRLDIDNNSYITTIPFGGVYKTYLVGDAKDYIVNFPDPKKNNGERITLINTDTILNLRIEGTWIPVSKNTYGGQIVRVAPQSTYEFVSIDSQWVCVNMSTPLTYYNIDLTYYGFSMPSNGVYQITDAHSIYITEFNIDFPDPSYFDGKTITIINSDNTYDANLGGVTPETATGTSVTLVESGKVKVFTSLGGKWFLTSSL